MLAGFAEGNTVRAKGTSCAKNDIHNAEEKSSYCRTEVERVPH